MEEEVAKTGPDCFHHFLIMMMSRVLSKGTSEGVMSILSQITVDVGIQFAVVVSKIKFLASNVGSIGRHATAGDLTIQAAVKTCIDD